MAFPCPQGSWTKLTCTKRFHPGPAPRSQDVLAAGTSAEHQQDLGCRERSIRDKAMAGGEAGACTSPAHRSAPQNRLPGFCFPRGALFQMQREVPKPLPGWGEGRAGTEAPRAYPRQTPSLPLKMPSSC